MPIPVPLQLALVGFSALYQHRRQQKLRREFERQRDESLGFEFVVSGEPQALAVVYGRNKIGGVRVYHDARNNLEGNMAPNVSRYWHYYNGGKVEGWSGVTPNMPDENGRKNEFLFVEQAVCVSGINTWQDIEVNDLKWDDATYKKGQWIHAHNSGNVGNIFMDANGVPLTNRFTNAASLRMCFKLDRENNNYTGVPDVTSYVLGQRVRTITNTGGVYAFSPGIYYSNNPVYCLADYLTNDLYGYGLADDEIDLKSFYEAAQICDRLVLFDRQIEGKIWRTFTTRNIPLYECNVILPTDAPLRENLARIMETMGQADLIWSEGKYKLKLLYPTTPQEQLDLISGYHFFSDADIVPDTVSISFPSAEERYNQYVIRYRNEHKDFEEDTVTWPRTGNAVYNTYLAEDGGILYKGETFLAGITDPYHATAMAEQYVRSSRRNFVIEFTLARNSRGMSLEPGDIFAIDSYNLGLDNEIFRVEEMEVNEDLTIKIKAYRFDYTDLAWNVDDQWAYIARPTYDFGLLPVTTGFTLTNTGLISSDGTYVPSIVASWGIVGDSAITLYELQWKKQIDVEYQSVILAGRTYEVYPTIPGTTYNFRVRSRSPTQVSDWLEQSILVPNDNTIPGLPSNFFITNGIKSISLKWDNHPDKDYAATKIYRNTTNNFATATLIASVRGTSYVDTPLAIGITYHYWLRAVDTSLNESNYVYGGSGVAQAIGTNDLGPNVVTADKIWVTDLSAISANLGTITVGTANIQDAAINSLKIGTSQVTVSQYTSRGTDYNSTSGAYTLLMEVGFSAYAGGSIAVYWQTEHSELINYDGSNNIIGGRRWIHRILVNGVAIYNEYSGASSGQTFWRVGNTVTGWNTVQYSVAVDNYGSTTGLGNLNWDSGRLLSIGLIR